MNLSELVRQLKQKPPADQREEVEFFVYRKADGTIVSCQMTGLDTTKIIKILAKRKNP